MLGCCITFCFGFELSFIIFSLFRSYYLIFVLEHLMWLFFNYSQEIVFSLLFLCICFLIVRILSFHMKTNRAETFIIWFYLLRCLNKYHWCNLECISLLLSILGGMYFHTASLENRKSVGVCVYLPGFLVLYMLALLFSRISCCDSDTAHCWNALKYPLGFSKQK